MKQKDLRWNSLVRNNKGLTFHKNIDNKLKQ